MMMMMMIMVVLWILKSVSPVPLPVCSPECLAASTTTKWGLRKIVWSSPPVESNQRYFHQTAEVSSFPHANDEDRKGSNYKNNESTHILSESRCPDWNRPLTISSSSFLIRFCIILLRRNPYTFFVLCRSADGEIDPPLIALRSRWSWWWWLA